MSAPRLSDLRIGHHQPTYFVADIAANHDGDLGRAKGLIELAKRAGADAAKFQNFRAAQIVSRRGFEQLGGMAHQAKWKRSVFEVYQAATLPWDWTPALEAHCRAVGIEFFSAPYDLEAVDMLDPHVRLYKIGSGDITWPELLMRVASKGKPVLLACGASDIGEVRRAVDLILTLNRELVLMQCNTNYTGSPDNLRYVQLNVLKTLAAMYPEVVLGLSDHTPGHASVLGAVALGARVVEKHFTDDNAREGPDHGFSMTPATWREMVDRTRELESALGSGIKRVEDNESQTVVVQRRSIRAARPLKAGTILAREHLAILRPAPLDAIFPYDLDRVLGKQLRVDLDTESYLTWTMLAEPA